MKTLTLALVLSIPGLAAPQPGVQPAVPRTASPQPQPLPPYQSLVIKDESNRVIRIDGVLEGLAILRNPLIDDAARQRIMPVIQDWTADLNQLAIDNLDFLEKLDAGYLQTLDPTNLQQMKTMQSILSQLTSASSLAARLNQKQLIDLRQMQICMQITNEYVQAVAMELSSPPDNPPTNDPIAQQARQMAISKAVNTWYQANSCRDVREQYRRILVDSAPLIDRIVPGLSIPSDQAAALAPRVEAVKAGKNDLEKMLAVRVLLDQLPFDQRRAFLAQAVALGAAPDPFHPAPAFPTPAPVVSPHAAATPPSPAGAAATVPASK